MAGNVQVLPTSPHAQKLTKTLAQELNYVLHEISSISSHVLILLQCTHFKKYRISPHLQKC